MIKATIFERYRHSSIETKQSFLKEVSLEERYFSSQEKFHEWYSSFKAKLWEDDNTKVETPEGVYVRTEEFFLDDVSEPRRMKLYSTFRNGVSYHYAA